MASGTCACILPIPGGFDLAAMYDVAKASALAGDNTSALDKRTFDPHTFTVEGDARVISCPHLQC
jgi:hypothetical protein